MVRKQTLFVLFALTFSFLFSVRSEATFYGDVKTGLQIFAEDQYGYSVYIPTAYHQDEYWPLVILLPDEGGLAEEYIEPWLDSAEQHGYILFCPNYPMPRSFPENGDKWILSHKEEIESQYAVDPERILIAGTGFGGHYSLYLALRYPKEFTSMASLGNALEGRFERMFRYSFRKGDKLPVLILKAGGDMSDNAKTELSAMEERGYLVEMVDARNKRDLTSKVAGPQVFAWFDEMSAYQAQRKDEKENQPGVKQRFFKWADDFLQNR
jgi:dienelactone hydrolase